MTQVLFNDQWLDKEHATVSLFSASVQFGYGLFETLRTYGDRTLPFADRHISRLMNSATEIGLNVNYSANEIKAMLHKVATESTTELQRIKIILLPEGLAIYSVALSESHLSKYGALLKTQVHERALPKYKSTAYLDCYMAWNHAQQAGYDDMLFLNSHEQVLEASRANIFCIIGTQVLTPESRILTGIMRDTLIALDNRIKVTEISMADLKSANGIFITNSIIGMRPVTKIDDHNYTDLLENPTYLALNNRLNEYIHR